MSKLTMSAVYFSELFNGNLKYIPKFNFINPNKMYPIHLKLFCLNCVREGYWLTQCVDTDYHIR